MSPKHHKPTAARKKYFIFIVLPLLLLLPVIFHGQTFTPVPVTGFDQDAIAEGGPNSLATTTSAVDGGFSNKIIYTSTFRTFAGIGGGGIPDNGTIVNGTSTYQLAPYNGNNALFVKRAEIKELTLNTPAAFNRIRLLCLSTEGVSLVNATVFFTDGSSTQYLTNYSLPDWFFNTTNLVLSGMGRCDRVAGPPYNADGYTANPRMYYMEIILNCTDRPKQIQKIRLANVTTAGNNAPFPNAIFLALSGSVSTQVVNNVITPSNCSGNSGSVALTVTGGMPPYSYSWNTTPVQTGATATGLAPGNYTVTITDGSGCTTSQQHTVPLNNDATLSAAAATAVVCTGQSTQLSVSAAGTLTSFTWTPGNLTGSTVTVSPTTTTTYTVTGTNTLGCSATATVTITVNDLPAAPVAPPVQICSGGNAILQVQNPQAGATYNWYTSATGGAPVFTGPQYSVSNVPANTTYYVEITNASGCTSSTRTAVNIVMLAPLPSPVVVVDNVTFNTVTFRWDPVPGAMGYEVSVNGGSGYQTPSSGLTGTTHTVSGLMPNQTVTLQVRALMTQACQNSLSSAAVSGTTLANMDIFIPNVFTPNNDGKNDRFLVYSHAIIDMKLNVYNQWGEKIFESFNIANGWDGRHKGVMQPIGVYAYVLWAKMQDGSVVTKKGSIGIIR
jgi:gliding motility-associated-like protein